MSNPQSPPAPAATHAEAPIAAYGVVVADDDDQVRHALAALLGDHQGFWLAGEAATGTEAAELCASVKPHAALIDVMMPAGGCEAAAAILAVSPTTVIAAYTARADQRTHLELMDCGVANVFVKGRVEDLATSLYELVHQHHQAL